MPGNKTASGLKIALRIGMALLLPLISPTLLKGENPPAISASSTPSAPYANTLFDPDPNHPWNQLYGMLFIRPGWDGKLYGLDEVDPLYWGDTRYLLVPPSHQQAVVVLDKFIQSHAAQSIKDPLRRALLERMLWSLFDHFAPLHQHPTPETRELEVRLVKIMKSVALTEAEIKALPDNYQRQIDAKTYASTFDPFHEEKPFLPEHMFSRANWIEVIDNQAPPGPTASPVHLEAVSCRSAFHVFISLPGGRADTLAYLQKLHDFEPLWTYDWRRLVTPAELKNNPTPPRLSSGPWLNPELPQVPLLTRFALVRTANLIDAKGDVINSPLVESIQFRVIRSMGRYKPESQAFGMFTLDQSKLMKGEGGLVAMGKNDLSFDLVLDRFSLGDRLESRNKIDPNSNGKVPQFVTCFGCHSGSGILSMNSFTRRFSEPTLDAPDFREDNGGPDSAGRKGREYNWGLLQAYWFDQD